MKGILIDPFARTVTQVEVAKGIDDIYKLIQARPFDCVRIDLRNAIYVDDEGLYREDQRFFHYKGYDQPLAGRGLILAADDEGESISCTLTLAHVKQQVTFPAVALAGFNDIPEGTTVEKYGEVWPVIGSSPVFGPDENAVVVKIVNAALEAKGAKPFANLENIQDFYPLFVLECLEAAVEAGSLGKYELLKVRSFIAKKMEAEDDKSGSTEVRR